MRSQEDLQDTLVTSLSLFLPVHPSVTVPQDPSGHEFLHLKWVVLDQPSPAFLAPGTSFMEDDFSTDRE